MSSASISKFLFAALLLVALPKARADGVPNVSTRTTSSDGWFVSADFLTWYASQEEASIWADVIGVGINESFWEAPGFDFKWDFGFRLGAGYNFVYDQWDTGLYWTWFRTEAQHKLYSHPFTFLGPEFFAAFLSGDNPQTMQGNWSLLFNMFDWELGRSYWISKRVSLRPFLGLKGGWINQSIHVKYTDLTISSIPTTQAGNEHLRNNFWGIGPVGGINSKWKIIQRKAHSFDLFGDFSMASLWGTWICSDVYKNTVPTTTRVDMKDSTLGALMFRGFMGIEWDILFHANKYRFSTKLGYEMQLWLDQLRLPTFQLQRLHNDLSLQGITFNCRFDF